MRGSTRRAANRSIFRCGKAGPPASRSACSRRALTGVTSSASQMDVVRNQKIILDAIDQLRKRKARPDLKGICHMLERKCGIGADEIARDLERLCELKTVIKQDYKGRISYRNAAKWRKCHEYGGVVGGVAPEPDDGGTGELLVRAVKELTKEARGAGCTLSQLDGWMRQHSSGPSLSLQELEAALEGECAGGNVQRMANGSYCRGDRKRQRRSTGGSVGGTVAAGSSVVAGSSGGSGAAAASAAARQPDDDARRSRSAGKRKRFRKSHGADVDSYNDSESAAPRGADEIRCDYCLQTAERNKRGEAEELLFCKDCNAMAHPSCMNYSAQLSRRAQMSPWQCIDCKTCCICQNADDPDSMLFCDACDKGYHMSCHEPAVLDKPTGKWACHRCQEDGLEPGGQSGDASPLHADSASGEGLSSRSSTVDSEEALKSPEQADENSTGADDVDVAAPAAATSSASTVTTTDMPAASKKAMITTDTPAPAKRAASVTDVPAVKRLKSEDGSAAELAEPSNTLLLPPPPPPPQVSQEASTSSMSALRATPTHSPRSDVSRSTSAPRSPQSTTKQASPTSVSSNGGPQVQPHQLPSTYQPQALSPLQQAVPPKQQISPPKQQQPVGASLPPPPQQKVSPLQLNPTSPMQQLAVPMPSSKMHGPLPSPRQHAPSPSLRHLVPPPASPRQQAPPSPSARQQAQLPLSVRQQHLQSAAPRLQQTHRSSPSRPQALSLPSPIQPRQQPILKQHDEPAKDKATPGSRYNSIPPSEWTVADVVQYFKNCGFYQESEKFMEQEIDGKSLLLLMRNDVLANMALTLGSALKIYERVKMLQACGSSKCVQQLTNGQR